MAGPLPGVPAGRVAEPEARRAPEGPLHMLTRREEGMAGLPAGPLPLRARVRFAVQAATHCTEAEADRALCFVGVSLREHAKRCRLPGWFICMVLAKSLDPPRRKVV